MKDGFVYRTVEIKACHKQEKSIMKNAGEAIRGGLNGAAIGGLGVAAVGVLAAVTIIFLPVAPILLSSAAIGGGAATGGGIGAVVGYVTSKIDEKN